MPPTGQTPYKAGGMGILPAYVPEFQRDYAWKKDVGSKLLQDIIHNTYTDSLMPNQAGQSIGDYHLGHILSFNQNSVLGKPIVDGQQRLFSLTVIACHLRDKALELGFNKLAFDIDNLWIWESGDYGHSKMLFKPKNCDYLTIQKMNPYEVLLRLCEIDHSLDVVVTADQSQGNNVSISVTTHDVQWLIRKNVKIKFDNGGILEVANEIGFGTSTSSISGSLTGNDVVVNEKGTVVLGNKSGEVPIKNSNMGVAIANLKEIIDDFIDNGGLNIGHLDTPEKRCNELKMSLESINFDTTYFPSEGAAIRHFGITNSASHQVALSSYDLLRAQVIEIRDANPVTNYLTNNSDDYKLFEQWKAFRKIIEPNLTKDSQKNNFFSRYFISKSLPHADPNKQFKELLDKNFNPVTRLWNKGPVTALLQELTNFLEWHQEIKQLGTTIPTNRHEEEFYLLLFPNSFKQWIPVYLAARNKFKNPKSQESINSLLRHIAEFWGKGNSLTKMCDDIPSIPPNKFFQKVPIWCEKINNLSDAPTNADVKSVLNGIKTDIDSLLTPINWTIANLKTDTSGNTRKFSGSNSDIKFILATIEKKLGGISDGSGRFRDGMINSDVEHILEKNLAFANKSADFVFNNTNFETSKQRLGNRLLFPKKSNNHIKGKSFVLKMHAPTCNIGNCVSGSLHYSSHNNQWKLVEKFLHKYQTLGVWNSSNIDSWEDTLIDLYHGCW